MSNPPATPQYRPALHFSPQSNWMNDPNGLVFHQGVWHLFFQHHPHGPRWGPMHWGHATSSDLIAWTEQPIALEPDALGMVFSGCVVADVHNTGGFGQDGITPLVAVFTHHDMAAQQRGSRAHQHQSLAISLDQGQTWAPYAANPVLPNPGHIDFRDPKLRWLPERHGWLMVLAVGDHVAFYSSPDLKAWTFESDFGADVGAHDGVWECPDLFPLTLDGRTHWVLLVSLVQGGPNGGSATQYFVGDFDGRRFTAPPQPTRWIDHGPDNYAGVTWADAPGGRTVFIAWMNNWRYAQELPTAPWCGAMTLPRDLRLVQRAGEPWLGSQPAPELRARHARLLAEHRGPVGQGLDLSAAWQAGQGRVLLSLRSAQARGFALCLSHAEGDRLVVGFDSTEQAYFIDRRRAGQVDFHPQFAGRHQAPRLADGAGIDLQLVLDATSVELFADGGLSCLTSLFFSNQRFDRWLLSSDDGLDLSLLQMHALRTDLDAGAGAGAGADTALPVRKQTAGRA